MRGYTQQGAAVRGGAKRNFLIFPLASVLALSIIIARGDSGGDARLANIVNIPFAGRQISLAKGTSVQVLGKDDRTATVSLQLPDGSPLITQIPLSSLGFASAQPPPASIGSSSAPVRKVATPLLSQPPAQDQALSSNPATKTESAPDSTLQNSLDVSNGADQALPAFSATLGDLDSTLPPKRYTALQGYFYILINGVAVPVVYSLPMEDHHLAKSASNLIFYGPYPNEQTKLTGNIVPKIVENLGCSVFSLSFKQSGQDLDDPKTAYWDKESPWFPAVLSARDEIIKGFGLDRKKLLLMGYSGGGGMVLNFAGAFPDEVEAVAAQGGNLAPDVTEKNSIKWLIINNRGESNAAVTLPFYSKLQSFGCNALYCETTPERGRGNYHAPSGQSFDLIYSFLAGILTQRSLEDAGANDLQHLWPYVAPKDPLKRYAIAKTSDLDEGVIKSGAFDLLPSAAFALNWSRVCAPTQTIKLKDDLVSLHVTFPACSKPIATVLYYSSVEYQDISRIVEDINSLAEHGYIVISPLGATKPDAFAASAISWMDTQGSHAGARVHLLGYGAPGANFISAMALSTDLNAGIQSISLVDFEDSTVDGEVKTNIETLARTCGMYGFVICSNSQPSATLANLANDLVTTASQERGCSKLFITRKITPDAVASDQDKVTSDSEALGTDNNKVALDNDKSTAQGGGLTPQDQDRATADQEQVELDQAQLAADQSQLRLDQRQADSEERSAEDQALNTVKALIDRANRS